MNDIAIRASGLTKRYRLYRNPTHRLLDVFGLLKDPSQYTEHLALDNIDIAIRRGERVGIIGRNGAGKSTLLRLVTRTIEPTSGTLEINGATQALLQIGTGFHPDFTGRDNVISYLSQLGIAGARATELTEDIIAFAEIEEYIDQPVKTYSTGMGARLMFAASTVIEPDVLVIDEVLGVGDAYFARKSYERIKSLCATHGSTLLLVSHDIYSAAQICNRMIWIDKGRVKFDGEPKAAINLYESSIKEQEEQRLRRKAMLAPGLKSSKRADGGRELLIEIKRPDGGPLTGAQFLYAAAVADGHEALARIDAATGQSSAETARVTGNAIELVYEGSNWLTAEEAGRTDGILLANHGQPFHKGALKVRVRQDVATPALALAIESATDETLVAEVHDAEGRTYHGGTIVLPKGARTEWSVPLDTTKLKRAAAAVDAGQSSRHGSGAVRITGVDILDAEGNSTRQLETGKPASFHFTYARGDMSGDVEIEIIVAFQRDGVLDVMRVFEGPLSLRAKANGAIRLDMPRLALSQGRYAVTVLVAKAGYYAKNDGIFYSINPNVFDALSRVLEFTVQTANPAYQGTAVIGDGRWLLLSE